MPPSRRFRTALFSFLLVIATARGASAGSLGPSGPAWLPLDPPAPLPSVRDGIGPIYDSNRWRMIVYGGGGAYFDVWALDLSGPPSWTQLAPSGTPPPGRAYYAAIFDWKRDRMIVFGGNSSGALRLNDVWALGLSGPPAWTSIVPSGTPPSPRANHSAIFDYARDRMIVFGGASTSSLLNDVWALDLSGTPAWTPIVPTGTPPAARSYASAIYDPLHDRMVMFGGTGRNDVWALSLSGAPAWSQMFPAGPLPHGRFGHNAFFHPARSSMIVFGGGFPGFPSYQVYNDTWELSLAGAPAWCQLAPAGSPPAGRLNHGAVYDPHGDRMVIFAGEAQGTVFVNDTWALGFGAPALGVEATGLAPARLEPPAPNPFRREVHFRFELARAEEVHLTVHDLQGREVARICEGRLQGGRHARAWSAVDALGLPLASGVYTVFLVAGSRAMARRCALVR